MNPPFKKDYPRRIIVGGDVWRVRWMPIVDKCTETKGICSHTDMEIVIKTGMSHWDTWDTFIHELLHAFEASYNTDLDVTKDHPLVYTLTAAIVQVLRDNF